MKIYTQLLVVCTKTNRNFQFRAQNRKAVTAISRQRCVRGKNGVNDEHANHHVDNEMTTDTSFNLRLAPVKAIAMMWSISIKNLHYQFSFFTHFILSFTIATKTSSG